MDMALALTLNDYRKRTAPDGKLDYIIETLAQSNPVLEDMKFMQGNLPTGIQTTRRTSIPSPSVRRINRGVDITKSSTEQILDTCMMLEDRSLVDVKLLALQSDKEAFRRSEDAAHVEGFAQRVAKAVFYGDIDKSADDFNGLSLRYKKIEAKGKPGWQVVSAGTPGSGTNTTAYLIGWGERTTAGIYPKETAAGLKMTDLGEADVYDADGKPFRALQTLFEWNVGLTVRDFTQNALLRNINAASLPATSDARRALVEKFIVAKNRVRNLNAAGVNFVWYVSDSIYTFLEVYLIDKNNVHVTRQDVMGKPPLLYLSGIPVKKVDAIAEDEAAVS
jgi:hypothetical protein